MKRFKYPAYQQLKTILAQLLPDLIRINPAGLFGFFWKDRDMSIQDTEWLHVCWLIECGLNESEHFTFRENLQNLCGSIQNAHSACWENRALAISQMKGITF